jgi:hypothetical protein
MLEPPVAPEVLPLAFGLLGLLGLDGIVLPDWASAVPLNSNTAAAVASRLPFKSSFVNCIGRLLLWRDSRRGFSSASDNRCVRYRREFPSTEARRE